jgi:hypothetical protein
MIDLNAMRPFDIWKKVLGARFALRMTEAEKEIWVAHEKCYNRLVNSSFEISRLNGENLRLKHENEFMLRLVNREDDHNEA